MPEEGCIRVVLVFAIALAALPAHAQGIAGTSAESQAALVRGEWRTYAGTYSSAKYSPLEQIDKSNAGELRVVWRSTSPDQALRRQHPNIDPSWTNQSTPLAVGGTLYVSTSLSQVAALDAISGQTKWVFNPQVHAEGIPSNNGWLHRGVAYWRSGTEERIILAGAHGVMVALDAQTGKPILSFGDNGRIDLKQGLRRRVARGYYTVSSPPVIVRDVIVVGSSVWDWPGLREMPPGDVRGFDVRTGKLLWAFKTIPEAGEPGVETWENESWKTSGSANIWAPMSADEELGYVYLPGSTPSNDYYGGHRVGDNLYAETLICLDASTGRRIWHYQFVRHGLWDYDLPAAPNLIDVTVQGRRIKAVAQVTKQNFLFVFDRESGKPVWPIEDRPVPQSKVPGERSAATQPFPTWPAPLDIQGLRAEDLIDLTPALKREAQQLIAEYDYGALYTPPTERGLLQVPGVGGGASWSGAAFDPETGILYATTVRQPHLIRIVKPPGTVPGDHLGRFEQFPGPQRLPLLKPPFGSMVAIDMNTGEHLWRVPVGNGPRTHQAIRYLDIRERLGWNFRSWPLATKTLLFVMQAGYQSGRRPAPVTRGRTVIDLNNLEPKLMVFDKASGALLHEIPVPQNATGAPMTYMAGGKQYIVFPAGGANLVEEWIAVALP